MKLKIKLWPMMMFKPVRYSSAYTEMMPGIAGRTIPSPSSLYKPGMVSPTSSWVDLSRESEGTPPTPVPFCTTSDYLVMLREAQRETSVHSSNRVSPIYSLRSSPHSSTPKSPPNSPNTEVAALEDKLSLHSVFINRDLELEVMETLSEYSGPCAHSEVWRMPRIKYKKRKDWSKKKEVIVTLVLTHMLAVGLGISLGIWVLRKKG